MLLDAVDSRLRSSAIEQIEEKIPKMRIFMASWGTMVLVRQKIRARKAYAACQARAEAEIGDEDDNPVTDSNSGDERDGTPARDGEHSTRRAPIVADEEENDDEDEDDARTVRRRAKGKGKAVEDDDIEEDEDDPPILH